MSQPDQPKPATAHTRHLHDAASLPTDAVEAERATRGLIAELAADQISGGMGVIWHRDRHAFLDGDAPAPDTVHPSLWQHAQRNRAHGLFEVAPGLWQVRGYDISNVTFIAGETGWVVIDPLTSASAARAALELANEHLGHREVTAVIYTHSHLDHFAGVHGVTTLEAVAAGHCRVIAPEGFLYEAIAENLLAGPAMTRRSSYQFGSTLAAGPMGHVDCGLGTMIAVEQPTLIAPTEEITSTGQELVVDGIRIVFQMTPETEAPAEMMFFFPDQGWFCSAELCTHTMHNLVPIRGAQVRNALTWSKYIGEANELFGADTTVLFASHNWPRWGNEDIRRYLALQQDLYRWIHDQTLRRANHGLTAPEIAEVLELPDEFLANGHTRGYYGDLVHNAKAVYQRYLSWYDGNPARLQAHPPVAAAERYVAFMGGADSVLRQARQSFETGDYRWVCEVVNHVVFAEPTNIEARQLQADSLEQLGYQAESSTFRNAYLTAAMELRQGPPPARPMRARGLTSALTIEQAFDAIAIRLKSEDVGGQTVAINWTFTDVAETWVLQLRNRTLSAVQGRHEPSAAVAVELTKALLLDIISGATTFVDEVVSGAIVLTGDAEALRMVFTNLDTFMSGFAIVEP